MQSLHTQAGVRTWLSLTPLLDHGIPVLGKRRGAANTSLGLEKCLGLALFQGHSTPRGVHSVMFHISFFTLSLVHPFPLLSTGSWHLLSFKPPFQPNSWQKIVERSCFLRLLMDWEETLKSAFSLSIPWETFRLHSGSPSFCLQFENHGQIFQRVTHCRRQDWLVTEALSRDFTCCPCHGEVLRFYLGFLTVCHNTVSQQCVTVVSQHCLSTPFSTTPHSGCLSQTFVGKSGLSRPQRVFDGGPLSLPWPWAGLAASFMPAARQSHFSYDPSPRMIW